MTIPNLIALLTLLAGCIIKLKTTTDKLTRHICTAGIAAAVVTGIILVVM